MFFNGKKLTNRKPKESRKVEFTDNFCRNYFMEDFREGTQLSDSLCKNLTMYVSKYGNHTYNFTSCKCARTIGSVHTMTAKEAREIVNNIRENIDEFLQEVPSIKIPLVFYFKKFGKFPHKPQGTEVIISDENSSLKKKIKDLESEVGRLNGICNWYSKRLLEIEKLAGDIFPTEDEKVSE